MENRFSKIFHFIQLYLSTTAEEKGRRKFYFIFCRVIFMCGQYMCGNVPWDWEKTYFLLLTKFAWCVTPLHTFIVAKSLALQFILGYFLFEFYCAHCNVLYLNKCILIKMEYISGGKYRFVRSEDKITFLWFILWYKWSEIRLYCNVLSSV